MDTRDIVRKAWQITQVHLKKLIWYGFVPSFFGVIVSSAYLAYQYNAFRHSALFGTAGSTDVFATVKMIWGLVSAHSALTVAFVVLAALILLGFVLTPPIFKGIMINALMRIKKYESIDGSVEVGVRNFFPLFEFGLLTGAFSINTLFTESSFILRWWGENVFFLALPILLFIAMVGLIVNFLFTYSEYYIVLEKKRLMKSMMESSVLVVANLRKTFLVFVLMMLIGVRIILNVVLVLLIPMVVIFLATYMASIFLSTWGLVFIGLSGFIVLVVSAYLLGLFQIFATAVWVLTFSELTEKNAEKSMASEVQEVNAKAKKVDKEQ